MRTIKLIIANLLFIGALLPDTLMAQEHENKTEFKRYTSRFGNEIRGKNAFTAAGGTAIMNGDFSNPLWEIYFHAGFKRFIGSHVNINVTYHKFNLAYKDLFNHGHMSFDINLEAYVLPFSTFTPYIYAGGGMNATNYFTRTDTKIQGGGGIEYLATERIGLKLFAEYNYFFTDEIDTRIGGESDDAYWRMGVGINIYFGKYLKKKSLENVPTVISSNPIIDE